MPHYNACLFTTDPAAYRFLVWLDEEWGYVARKFGNVTTSYWDDALLEGDLDEWTRQAVQYLDRAKAFGLDTPAGKQAVAKFAATAVALAGSVVRVHGDLPRGGTPSGEVVPR